VFALASYNFLPHLFKTKPNLLRTFFNFYVYNSEIAYLKKDLTMRKRLQFVTTLLLVRQFLSAVNVHSTQLRFESKQQKNLGSARKTEEFGFKI